MKIVNKIQLIGSLDENKVKPHLDFFNDRFLNASNIGLRDSVLFNLSVTELENKVFDNSYGAAIADTVVWHGLLKNYSYKNEIKEVCKNVLMDCIVAFFNGSVKNYRSWHSDTMDKIMRSVNAAIMEYTPSYSGQLWTIGNSQKVINLVMKYVWVISLKIKKTSSDYKNNAFYNKYGEIIFQIAQELDIPVDRYIIYSIHSWNLQKVLDCKDMKVCLPMDNKGNIKEWSKWDLEDYNQFSSTLHTYFRCPIVWEGYAWEVGKLQCKSNNNLFHLNPYVNLHGEERAQLAAVSSSNGFDGHEELLQFLK